MAARVPAACFVQRFVICPPRTAHPPKRRGTQPCCIPTAVRAYLAGECRECVPAGTPLSARLSSHQKIARFPLETEPKEAESPASFTQELGQMKLRLGPPFSVGRAHRPGRVRLLLRTTSASLSHGQPYDRGLSRPCKRTGTERLCSLDGLPQRNAGAVCLSKAHTAPPVAARHSPPAMQWAANRKG